MFRYFCASLAVLLLSPGSLDAQSENPSDGEAEGPTVESKTEGGLEIASGDGRFSFELGGRLMVDAAFYKEGSNALGNGTELRRARLELEGRILGKWQYEFDIDAAASIADIKDAFIRYNVREEEDPPPVGEHRTFDFINVTVGQFKEAFSLEELTGSKYITFMERSLVNDPFTPARSVGAAFAAFGPKLTLSAGIFGESFAEDVLDEGDEGWAITGRFTTSPVREERRLLHLGVAASHRRTDEQMNTRIRSRPESHILGIRYVDTGFLDDVTRLVKLGVEGAGVLGPVSIQGEYIRTGVGRTAPAEDLTFDGGYVMVSWFLTGESRPYDEDATFARVKPKGPKGAWEIAARFSTVDLTDDDVFGGVESNFTLGLNWYLNNYVRLMVNYVFIDADENANGNGKLRRGDQPQALQVRLQLAF